MFISPAYAQAAGGAAGPSGLEAFVPIILIFIVFYFLLIRPQQKKMKEHRALLESIRRGDEVVTGGGIMGKVVKVVDDHVVVVEIADGIKVKVQRALISTVVSKTEPVKGGDKDKPANDAAEPQEKKGGMLGGLLGGGKKGGDQKEGARAETPDADAGAEKSDAGSGKG